VVTADGQTLVFVIFANNFENSSAVINAATDEIIVPRLIPIPTTMNAELESYSDQLLSVRQDAVGPDVWVVRRAVQLAAGAGALVHDRLLRPSQQPAAQLFIPRIDAAIARAAAQNLRSDGPFAYSAFRRWCVRTNVRQQKCVSRARRVQPESQRRSMTSARIPPVARRAR
jgi:hypothetical protein